jgi:hypothetical protein
MTIVGSCVVCSDLAHTNYRGEWLCDRDLRAIKRLEVEMPDEVAAERYRLGQAQQLIDDFRCRHPELPRP